MEVLKFGGTSVGSYERILHVLKIITNNTKRKTVVLSAMAGTTNKLKDLAKQIEAKDFESAHRSCTQLKEEYLEVIRNLYEKEIYRQKARKRIDYFFQLIASFINKPFSAKEESIISAQGELISTELFHLLCQEKNIQSALLPALEFMKLNEQGCPDNDFIKSNLERLISVNGPAPIYITQGYICKNCCDEIDNLGRGGSDYTATIIGAVLDANEIQIWTDIDGVHNNDPRHVNHTVAVAELSYEEAGLLAYFGAKILHPTSVIPAKDKLIPLSVKNTFDPNAKGTLIKSHYHCQNQVDCVVSIKDEECLIQLESNNKLSCNNFLLKIFEICQKQQVEIDMVSIAHQSVSLVVNEKFNIDALIEELIPYAELKADKDYAIINMVGKHLRSTNMLNRIFKSIKSIPIKMLNQNKGDCSHMQLLVDAKYKIAALEILNNEVLRNRIFSKIEKQFLT